jgi:hypothetical protein
LQVAEVFETITANNLYWMGVHHVFSPDILNKSELLSLVSKIYNLNIMVNPVDAPTKCDRTMSTIYPSPQFNIPDLETQIQEQKDFYPILFGN